MVKWFFRLLFRLNGWKFDDNYPREVKKCVMIGVPHTSNWDFIYTIACFDIMKIPLRFTIKQEWMKWPFKGMLRSLGALPIDRSPREAGEERLSMTDAMIRLLKEREELVVLVTPEGTRSKREKWKTGYYYAALGADVPILCAYLDYKNKRGGIAMAIQPTGDYQKDMLPAMEFYQNANPRHPEKFSVDLTVYEPDSPTPTEQSA